MGIKSHRRVEMDLVVKDASSIKCSFQRKKCLLEIECRADQRLRPQRIADAVSLQGTCGVIPLAPAIPRMLTY
jgi:hypothetical protein